MRKLAAAFLVVLVALCAFALAGAQEAKDPWELSDSAAEAIESLTAKSRALQARINGVFRDEHKRLERDLPALVTSTTEIKISDDYKRWVRVTPAAVGS